MVMMLESVIPDKRPPGTRSQNASFVHKGLGLSQQVLSPSETGKKARGTLGTLLARQSIVDIFKINAKKFSHVAWE